MNFDSLRAFLKGLEGTYVNSCEMIVSLDGIDVFEYTLTDKPKYLAYSLTKPVICAAALKLLEKGRLALDDKLSDYIPEFKAPKVLEMLPTGERRIRSAKREIVLKDLFTMTAGFSYDIKQLHNAGTVEAVRRLAQTPLFFDPGEHWEYSLCHDVLGAVVELVSGTRLSEYVRREIFEPLCMPDTRFLSAGAEDIAPLYSAKTLRQIPLDMTFYAGKDYDSGGAGLVTTVRDYSEFCKALAAGRVIKPCTLELMTSDFLTDKTRPDFNWPQTKGYGYGLGVRTLIDRTGAGALSSIGEFGWGGISGSYSIMDTSRRLSAVFMTHTLGADEKYLFSRIRNVIYASID